MTNSVVGLVYFFPCIVFCLLCLFSVLNSVSYLINENRGTRVLIEENKVSYIDFPILSSTNGAGILFQTYNNQIQVEKQIKKLNKWIKKNSIRELKNKQIKRLTFNHNENIPRNETISFSMGIDHKFDFSDMTN